MFHREEQKKGFSGLQVFAIVILAMAVAATAAVFAARAWFFPRPFKPVVLSAAEEKRLERKLALLERPGLPRQPETGPTSVATTANNRLPGGRLQPEPYSEAGASREIILTERELNGMLARNTDLASKVAIDLAENLVSARLLLPVDPDFPILGGKILRVKAGLELAYRHARPVVIIRGVSIMGVPVPSAWLGGLKNVDLVQEFHSDQGFWHTFAAGVESLAVREGKLHIVLKE